MLDFDFVTNAVSGKTLSNPQQQFSTWCVDNRSERVQGALFIPLVGESHDAHNYVKAAVEAGAAGVIVHEWREEWEALKKQASFIQVEDTLKALQDLAKNWRTLLKAQVIALTGSNGKTTTKDFLSQILKGFGKTQSSYGSFNNHWGVPFTLLDCPLEADFCVTEMGMNHAGEIQTLMDIAKPNLVTVTNVGRAHMGNFSDGIEGVAKAKEEIYAYASPKTQMVFNIDNSYTQEMFKKYCDRYPSFTYSTKNFSADVYLKVKEKKERGLIIEGQIGGEIGKAELQFWGEHNVENLCAAVALTYIAVHQPQKIWEQLSKCHTGWGRNQWVPLKNGGEVLFDGYNANPDSFKKLIENITPLVQANSQAIAVFGEMLELGDMTQEEHIRLGALAAQLPWQECVFIGPSASYFAQGWVSEKTNKKPIIFDSYKESLDLDLPSMVNEGTLIIVKGSRGGALERVVERLEPQDFAKK